MTLTLNPSTLTDLELRAQDVLGSSSNPNDSATSLAALVSNLLPQLRAAVMMAGPALVDATEKTGRCGAWVAARKECGAEGQLFRNRFGGECCRSCYDKDRAKFNALGSRR